MWIALDGRLPRLCRRRMREKKLGVSIDTDAGEKLGISVDTDAEEKLGVSIEDTPTKLT